MLSAYPEAVAVARRERRSGNLPEVLIWRELRKRPDGFKFRRQHPIGGYSLDFACLAARLAIEIDGEAHNMDGRPARDAKRDADLTVAGFSVLRIPARDVLADLDAVIACIVAACRELLPLHHPADGPPPRAGEVFQVPL